MRAWRRLLRPRLAALPVLPSRSFTTKTHERVQVQCGSSGYVNIDLFNVAASSPESPVLIHLPPFASGDEATPTDLPASFQEWPIARINYRWAEQADEKLPYSGWPTPIHDTAFAYEWLVDNLAPSSPARRDIYVYGSFFGASIALSLALTECHGHARFGVRGVAAYNGIYNWTMFLPEHAVHKYKGKGLSYLVERPLAEGLHLADVPEQLPDLFRTPANLFDPFISPSLLFHNPGLLVPGDFDGSPASSPISDMVARLVAGEDGNADLILPIKVPRKSHLLFPPRTSTLKIPSTLLMHDKFIARTPGGRISKRKPRGNTFMAQAEELAELMRRSMEKLELKDRSNWDDDYQTWEAKALRRIQVADVGVEHEGLSLGEAGEERLADWLEEFT
ncbi:unnamed protein product [Clonostachys solani]|uniref:Alpha/beta hydrolase fold-3 domain-containing protein n=1 Tax=Clonostachys solani TaxID=160281 RepID=A0A9N9Z3R4_9HYPO|nr:unnamed protein product [Clonostachys solani]